MALEIKQFQTVRDRNRLRAWVALLCLGSFGVLSGCSMQQSKTWFAADLDPSLAPPPDAAAPSAARQAENVARVTDARDRRGDHYAERLAHFLEDTPTRPQGGTVFLGDSITERMPLDDALPGGLAINRGIGGDRIAGVLERLDVSVAQLAPRRVCLLIGVNDIVWGKDQTPLEYAREYDALLTALRRAAPGAEIIVHSILPMRDGWAGHNAAIRELNLLIRPLAELHGYRYLDLHPWMGDDAGLLRREYSLDGIHLSLEGYLAWFETLLPRQDWTKVALNLGPARLEARSSTRSITKVDPDAHHAQFAGARGSNEMVVYTPAYVHPTTRTNEWGYEATVRQGRVARSGGNDSPIPEDGYVVSGHGIAATWIQAYLTEGVRVERDGQTLHRHPLLLSNDKPTERLRMMRHEVLDLLPALANRHGADSREVRRAMALLADIRTARGGARPPSQTHIESLARRVRQFD